MSKSGQIYIKGDTVNERNVVSFLDQLHTGALWTIWTIQRPVGPKKLFWGINMWLMWIRAEKYPKHFLKRVYVAYIHGEGRVRYVGHWQGVDHFLTTAPDSF